MAVTEVTTIGYDYAPFPDFGDGACFSQPVRISVPSVIHPSRNGLHPKHGKCLINFVHTYGLFSLLQLADKAKSEAGAHGKFFLRQAGFFSLLFNICSNRTHILILYPFG